MATDKLYFIAILPPAEVSAEITAFKTDMDVLYSSKAALKSMPHITLKAPFKLPTEKCGDLLQWFSNLRFGTTPFEQQLKNFGCFDNTHSKVIFC